MSAAQPLNAEKGGIHRVPLFSFPPTANSQQPMADGQLRIKN
jgi:hypothetical protein